MKHANTIVAALLGLAFIIFGLNFFLQFLAMPPLPEGTPPAAFMGAMYATGYLTFVKVLEILGGVLVIPGKTRTIGLLILGPILVNILAFHVFMTGKFDPAAIGLSALALFLLWTERKAFGRLVGLDIR